jgi:hypothetical protein
LLLTIFCSFHILICSIPPGSIGTQTVIGDHIVVVDKIIICLYLNKYIYLSLCMS